MVVMVLKAFPLDYEGEVTAENRPAFEHRQRALIRLYQRRIGFEPVVTKRWLTKAGCCACSTRRTARRRMIDLVRPATKKPGQVTLVAKYNGVIIERRTTRVLARVP
jgi:hypothetical protein